MLIRKTILMLTFFSLIPTLLLSALIDEDFFLGKPKDKWMITHLGSENILAAFNLTSNLDCCIIVKVKYGQYAMNVLQYKEADSFNNANIIRVIVDGTSYPCEVVQNNKSGCLALFNSNLMQALIHGHKFKVKIGSDVVLDFSLKDSGGPLRDVINDPI
jgi:hypothetical protein